MIFPFNIILFYVTLITVAATPVLNKRAFPFYDLIHTIAPIYLRAQFNATHKHNIGQKLPGGDLLLSVMVDWSTMLMLVSMHVNLVLRTTSLQIPIVEMI